MQALSQIFSVGREPQSQDVTVLACGRTGRANNTAKMKNKDLLKLQQVPILHLRGVISTSCASTG